MVKRSLSVFVMAVSLWATPNAPSNLNLTPHTHSVDISWSDNSQDESGFKIYRAGQLIKIVPENVTSYTDTGLRAGTTYKYTIKATDDKIIYVDSTAGGDDEFYEDMSDGTQNYPFLFIQQAVSKARPGDIIYVKAGDYYENIKINHSGTKDKPITIIGEKGATIYGIKPINANWQKIGKYSYKTTDIPYKPFSMMVEIDGKLRYIPRLKWRDDENEDSSYRAETILSYPPTRKATVFIHEGWFSKEQLEQLKKNIDLSYWDGIEAVYTYDPAQRATYIRFKNGDDPKNFKILIASGERTNIGNFKESRYSEPIHESATIDIDNSSYIVIRGFKIFSAQNGILIHGENAAHNVIEDNEIINGARRVSISRLAHDNVIRNNILHTYLINPNFRPIAWLDWEASVRYNTVSDAQEEKRRAVSEHIYNVYKHEVGTSTFAPLESCGVFYNTSGDGNSIYGNEIYDLLGGAIGIQKGNIYIHDNYFHHIASVATGPSVDYRGPSYIYNNRFKDVHIAYRVQLNFKDDVNKFKQIGYFFNNVLKNPKNIGSHFDIAGVDDIVVPNKEQLPQIYIYHNTFIGGGADNQGLHHHLGDKIFVVNNIFLDNFIMTYNSGNFGLFAYNWSNILYGVNASENGKNGNVSGESLWDTDSIDLKNFNPSMVKVPSNSTAHEAGVDLSKEFTVDGKVYKPFPMLKSGYYKGSKPDIGVVY